MSRMTVNGISVCLRGEERYEYFTVTLARGRRKRLCQYDYRAEEGELFTCVAETLDKCRQKRDEWLETLYK